VRLVKFITILNTYSNKKKLIDKNFRLSSSKLSTVIIDILSGSSISDARRASIALLDDIHKEAFPNLEGVFLRKL
jgi:hypothetical protein